jgi:hypothetical protein
LKNKIAVILFSTPLFNHVYFFKKKKNKNWIEKNNLLA